MKLIKHGDSIVALVERASEKTYLTTQREKQEWIPLFLVGSTTPIAEINSTSRLVRLCPGQALADEQRVAFHENQTVDFNETHTDNEV
jgi:hypothetical protein